MAVVKINKHLQINQLLLQQSYSLPNPDRVQIEIPIFAHIFIMA